MDTEYVLNIQGMTKRLESGGSQFILEIPELNLRRGRFYGLVGRSGSGKSTLLDLLAMVARPSEVNRYELRVDDKTIDLSRMLLNGEDREISRVRLAHFGYILQSGGLFSFLTVRENLQLPFMLDNRPADQAFIERLVELYDMKGQLDKKPSSLSGGQRQRVSILRSLCLSPDIILADEPTASVDENLADKIIGEMKRLAASTKATVIMVSHDLDLVKAFADEVITLKPRYESSQITRTVISAGDHS
ncbi:ABC transporter ATP-binding protein [Mesorhizobium sp. M0323]|uniref:ABC transporter ATP-binding protein n=1 Tax=Mesorhizobium sp. M0323 TaxID=2956938 RepID=UPI0033359DF4